MGMHKKLFFSDLNEAWPQRMSTFWCSKSFLEKNRKLRNFLPRDVVANLWLHIIFCYELIRLTSQVWAVTPHWWHGSGDKLWMIDLRVLADLMAWNQSLLRLHFHPMNLRPQANGRGAVSQAEKCENILQNPSFFSHHSFNINTL